MQLWPEKQIFKVILEKTFEFVSESLILIHNRAVARSEIPGGLVVLGGDNVSPLVKIGLADLPNIGGG